MWCVWIPPLSVASSLGRREVGFQFMFDFVIEDIKFIPIPATARSSQEDQDAGD